MTNNVYSSVSVSGYNSNPPPNDGTETTDNQVDWTKHKSKLGDPLKNAIESINTNVAAGFGKIAYNSKKSKTSTYTTVAGDVGALIDCSGTFTLTLLAAATAGNGYVVFFYNSGSGTVTLSCSDNINGSTTLALLPGMSAWVMSNGSTYSAQVSISEVADNSVTEAKLSGGGLVPVGTVVDYAGATAPSNWLLCFGQTIGAVGSGASSESADYETLFDLIKGAYGNAGTEVFGDGDTVALPDLRGRVTAGKDDMGGTSANRLTDQSGGLNGDTLGDTGGAETHTLTEAEMPAHTHDMTLTNRQGNSIDGNGREGWGSDNISAGSGTNTTASTGSGGAHNNVQPTIVLNKIIRYKG